MPDQDYSDVIELDWMLQNGQIEDDVLMEGLVSEYFHSLRQIGHFILQDPLPAGKAAIDAVVRIVNRRHKINGSRPLKILLFMAAYEENQGYLRKKGMICQTLANQNQDYQPRCDQQNSAGQKMGVLAKIREADYLLLYLHFVHGFSSSDIALITGRSRQTIIQELIHIRTDLLNKDCPSEQTLQQVHPKFFKQILSARCCPLGEDEGVQLDLHLLDCCACKGLVDEVRVLDESLSQTLGKLWPNQKLDRQQTLQALANRERGNKHRLQNLGGLKFKELAMGTIALLSMLVIGWYGSQFYIHTDPAPVEANPKNIIILQITATPQSPVEVMETAVPSLPKPGRKKPDPIMSSSPETVRISEALPDRNRLTISMPHPPFKVSGSSALAVVLWYWGWEGTLDQIIEHLQPDPYGSKLSPDAMVEFAMDQAGLKVIVKNGGDFTTLQNGIDAGYPIIVQKGYGGFERDAGADSFQVVYGYNPEEENVSLVLENGLESVSPIGYGDFARDWKSSDFLYMVVYPEEDENRVKRAFYFYEDMGFYKYLLMRPIGYDHYFR
jgi:hypothetical protein